jgi:hypothetical protein
MTFKRRTSDVQRLFFLKGVTLIHSTELYFTSRTTENIRETSVLTKIALWGLKWGVSVAFLKQLALPGEAPKQKKF